eukprot:TRINITY_DN4797_c0_g1_i2.p1 TRINITY_DN4797_c0_g1~~TRINITY_DN4797_c0_g1_i2.p1  ORF type:complete len:224 (-),score=16.28 TRINITY_DN4797_c0_g1_i2:180-776(-)
MATKPAATMGRLDVKPDPKTFLKAKEKTAPLEKTDTGFKYETTRKPSVPSRTEFPPIVESSSKNFLETNKIDSALTAPKKRHEVEVDYLRKEDFGKVPEYLTKVKEVISEEQKARAEAEESARNKNKQQFRLLSEAEKSELLAGLKKNHDTINAEYNTLPIAIHTLAQKQRKESIEKQLKQIETDMERLSKKEVYVKL